MAQLPEQVAAVQQVNLDFFFGAIGKTFEALEKLIRLNLNTAKSAMSEWYQRTQNGLSKAENQDASAMADTLVLPSSEQVLTYERQVAEITSTMQSQLAEVFEAQYEQANRQLQQFVESVSKNGPVGSDVAVAFMNQIVTLANTARESSLKTASQAANFAQSGSRASTGATAQEVDVVAEEVQKSPKAPKS